MGNKKVSVIIPCFNAAKWLPQCFLSLAGQTIGIHNLQLIFVNDASTDDGATWNLLQEMERAYPDDVLIIDLVENRRQGGARNEGLKYTRGGYVAFVDADDWAEPDLYEKVYEYAKAEDADIVQFNYYENIGANEKISNGAMAINSNSVIHISTVEERKAWLMSSGLSCGAIHKLYKRELLEKANVKFAEHTAYEEPLFVYPLFFHVSCIGMMHEALYHYRFNSEGTTFNYLTNRNTLWEHPKVQLAVWKFMKETEFIDEYYEEIKLYFLHSYLYETLYFAKKRGFDLSLDEFRRLTDVVKEEVKDYDSSVYGQCIPEEMDLYKKVRRGVTTEDEVKKIMEAV